MRISKEGGGPMVRDARLRAKVRAGVLLTMRPVVCRMCVMLLVLFYRNNCWMILSVLSSCSLSCCGLTKFSL
jgi:hypothetical protein